MPICQIIYVARPDKTFHWKWRHVRDDGSVTQSREAYALYYECVLAARDRGYEPEMRRPLAG